MVTEQEMMDIIYSRIHNVKDYEISIGTDSQSYENVNLIIVVCAYIVGKGGFYFYKTINTKRFPSLRDKINTETTESIKVGTFVKEYMESKGLDTDKLYLDSDIGKNGPTKELINSIVGWIVGMGFNCRIKPEGYAACRIADRHSK